MSTHAKEQSKLQKVKKKGKESQFGKALAARQRCKRLLPAAPTPAT